MLALELEEFDLFLTLLFVDLVTLSVSLLDCGDAGLELNNAVFLLSAELFFLFNSLLKFSSSMLSLLLFPHRKNNSALIKHLVC